jgi:ribosomal protein L37AE/L43A
MVQQFDRAARTRTYDKNACPQCDAWLLAPDWSCTDCGYGFETTVFFPVLEKAVA